MEDDNQVVTLEEDTDNQSTISETTILSDQSEGNNVESTLSKGDNINGVEGACVNARYEDQVLEGTTANSVSNYVEDDNQAVTLEEDTVNQSTISETTIVSDQSEGNNVEPTSSKGDNVDGVEGACVNARHEDQVLEGTTAVVQCTVNSVSNHVEDDKQALTL